MVGAMPSAVFLNPSGGPPWGAILFGIGVVGLVVAFLWVRRIAAGDEDPDASFWRSHPRGGRGSRVPVPTIGNPPTWGWIVTRLQVVVAVGSVGIAVFGPMVLTRWARPINESAGLAAALWIVAILAALAGTFWILRIAYRGLEQGPSWWRSSRGR
jgi:hypothetical protein